MSDFVWHELMTTDVAEAQRFYERVADVSIAPVDEEPGAYSMFIAEGRPVGGLVGPRAEGEGWPSGGPDAHWISYFGVEDVDAAAETARGLGGQVLLEPVDVPEWGRAAVLRDPQGAAFGVFTAEPRGG